MMLQNDDPEDAENDDPEDGDQPSVIVSTARYVNLANVVPMLVYIFDLTLMFCTAQPRGEEKKQCAQGSKEAKWCQVAQGSQEAIAQGSQEAKCWQEAPGAPNNYK